MVYLIIQIKDDQPTIMPFESHETMEAYHRAKLGEDKTVVAVTENVYFTRIKEK